EPPVLAHAGRRDDRRRRRRDRAAPRAHLDVRLPHRRAAALRARRIRPRPDLVLRRSPVRRQRARHVVSAQRAGESGRPREDRPRQRRAPAEAVKTVHYIDGQWAPSGTRTFEDRNPYNDRVVAEVAAGGPDEAADAVAAAAAAFPGWEATAPGERQRLFLAA